MSLSLVPFYQVRVEGSHLHRARWSFLSVHLGHAFRVRWFPEALPHLRSICSFRNNCSFEHFQHLNLLKHSHHLSSLMEIPVRGTIVESYQSFLSCPVITNDS